MPPPPLDCFAVAAPGLEPLVAAELCALAAGHRLDVGESEPGGVGFRADLSGVAAANLHLRIATRVLVRVATFHARAFSELERRARAVPWDRFVAPGRGVRFRVTSRKSRLYHQDAVAERLAGVVAARVGGPAQPPASPETGEADDAQEFIVRLVRDECVVSADSSGDLLHRRGYRLTTAKAPLRETLAAAILSASGWDGAAPLLDPMCGSGTIPIEAARLARRIPAGLGRRFALERWPEFDAAAWESQLAAARDGALPAAPGPILGSDRDAGAIAAATANAERAGVAGDVRWRCAALSAIEPPSGPGWLVTNPPYGVRLGERLRLRDLYAQLGNVARRRLPGWQVALLAGHPDLVRQTQLALTERLVTENGGIRVRLMQGRVG